MEADGARRAMGNGRRPAHWRLPNKSGEAAAALARALELEPLVGAVLASRGFIDPAAARDFLSPSLQALHDPLTMRDMPRAAQRLLEAVRGNEAVLLYGDYDVDGTCSIVILKKAIEILGGRADFHIPDRLREGYGMRSDVIERAAANGVKLIVSVDTGIRGNEEVRRANQLGIDVIITDHHLPEVELPPAYAVLNPNRRDCEYPDKNLCGAGVTFKLVQALLRLSGMPAGRQAALLDSFLKPVAIATVADLVPLTGENRVIVRRGLSGLRMVKNAGLRALLAVAGFDEGECPSAHQVAFRLAPRINAAGRMATASDVIELFLTSDDSRARELAGQLDTLNRERQQAESEIVEAILRECEQDQALGTRARALIFAGVGWHAGVLGIVASRLVERFCRPVFVLSDAYSVIGSEAPHLTGSGRSIPAFHLLEALESMAALFTRFGGHRQAAGVTLRAADLEEFRRSFEAFAGERLEEEDLRPSYAADAHASFADLSELCVSQILSLGPFGFGNPAPVFHCCGTEVAAAPRVLQEGKHYQVPLRHQGRTLFVKAWNYGDRAELFEAGRKLDLLFQVEDDPYSRKRGYGSWCLSLKDARASVT
jgi:single-stranded-DNA-specific exonuclease